MNSTQYKFYKFEISRDDDTDDSKILHFTLVPFDINCDQLWYTMIAHHLITQRATIYFILIVQDKCVHKNSTGYFFVFVLRATIILNF